MGFGRPGCLSACLAPLEKLRSNENLVPARREKGNYLFGWIVLHMCFLSLIGEIEGIYYNEVSWPLIHTHQMTRGTKFSFGLDNRVWFYLLIKNVCLEGH